MHCEIILCWYNTLDLFKPLESGSGTETQLGGKDHVSQLVLFLSVLTWLVRNQWPSSSVLSGKTCSPARHFQEGKTCSPVSHFISSDLGRKEHVAQVVILLFELCHLVLVTLGNSNLKCFSVAIVILWGFYPQNVMPANTNQFLHVNCNTNVSLLFVQAGSPSLL